jgi:hypothetical protein
MQPDHQTGWQAWLRAPQDLEKFTAGGTVPRLPQDDLWLKGWLANGMT